MHWQTKFALTFTLFVVLVFRAELSSNVIGQTQVQQDDQDSARPNIILINLDDADKDIFADKYLDEYLPNIKTLATTGLRFTNCHVTTPLCGPSRASLLRGQHAHRIGIKTNRALSVLNNGYTGEYDVFKARGFDKEHLGVWMHRSGYRTMMIGKYLHGRIDPTGMPGWDDLFMCFGGRYFRTSHYGSRYPENSRRRATGDDEYRIVVEAREAVGMIEAQHKRNQTNSKSQPFFLYIASLAPHLPQAGTEMIQKEYREIGKDIRIADTPDFNEADVSDKPEHLQTAKLDEEQLEDMHHQFRNRIRATKSVDDMVARLFDVLDRTAMRENTYIFFTSDHGYQLGHNRMMAKKLPYHRNTTVPMFVVGPGVKKGSANHLLSHLDLSATFLEIADAKTDVDLDGKSWVPLLTDPDSISTDEFRKSLLIQNWEEKNQFGGRVYAIYSSLRMQSQIYTRWANGAGEFYDLTQDPYQLENKFQSLSPEQVVQFDKQLNALKQGDDKPIATVASSHMISRTPNIAGVVEDNESVKSVEIEVIDDAKQVYWNGASWQKAKSAIKIDLANPGGLVSDWTYKLDLSTIENEGSITVLARGKDNKANESDVAQYTFKVDAVEPETEVQQPAKDSTVSSPVLFYGSCSDNHQMYGIEITLFRYDTESYWDGTAWGKTKATFFKRAGKELWHSRLPLPLGRYRVSARSKDSSGNYDSTPSVNEFSVK